MLVLIVFGAHEEGSGQAHSFGVSGYGLRRQHGRAHLGRVSAQGVS